jgi:tetratricopeptide (TPR) repeat protein
MRSVGMFRDAAKIVVDPHTPNIFTSRFITYFLMNPEQIEALFTEGDDYEILGYLNDVYWRSLEVNVAEAESIVTALITYYLDKGRFGTLTLEEAHAGLGYRPAPRLWERFVTMGSEGRFVRSLIAAAEAEPEIANFNRLKAGIDRRAGRLDEAETALQTQHAILLAANAGKDKLGFVEYEMGYVAFLKADAAAAIELFRDSQAHSAEGGDPTGAWIARCVEYRVRWLFGRSSAPATRAMFHAAKEQFTTLTGHSPRKLVARRWIANALCLQIEVCFSIGDADAARALLEECKVSTAKVSTAKESVPPAGEGYLDAHEGIVALLEGNPSAVRLWEGVVSRKAGALSLTDWHRTEAAAMDFYYLGLAYKQAREDDRAAEAWRQGLAFPLSMGNQIWHARCEAELETLFI